MYGTHMLSCLSAQTPLELKVMSGFLAEDRCVEEEYYRPLKAKKLWDTTFLLEIDITDPKEQFLIYIMILLFRKCSKGFPILSEDTEAKVFKYQW